jgi:hypothetical protein
MPQQELNLFQLAALRAAELRRRPPQIMRRQLADPDCRLSLIYDSARADSKRLPWMGTVRILFY